MKKVRRGSKFRVKPSETGVTLPYAIDRELFERGYRDGHEGNILKSFKASYRLGFRKAKLEIASQEWRATNIRRLPGKIKFRSRE